MLGVGEKVTVSFKIVETHHFVQRNNIKMPCFEGEKMERYNKKGEYKRIIMMLVIMIEG